MTDRDVAISRVRTPTASAVSATPHLSTMFAPRGVAVVGASRKLGKLGTAMLESLTHFPGTCAPVNASDDTMFPNLTSAAQEHSDLDLAVLCVPASATASVLQEAADAGISSALICAGGFGEIGSAGEEHQRALERVVANTGIRLLGPNTSGFFRPYSGLVASFVPGAATLSAGSVGIVAASGGVNHALAFQLERAGAGVSLGVGIGGAIDVSTSDVLDYFVDDETTRAVALHIESVPDGPALLESVRRLSEFKPVVALVVGKHSVEAFARSHTGALATSWSTTRALLRQAGAVIVENESELVNAVSALTTVRLSPAKNAAAGLITGQAGPGLIIVDELGSRGVSLPTLGRRSQALIQDLLPPLTYLSNPVDTGRPGPDYPAIIEAVADDPNIDMIGIYGITEPVISLVEAVTESGAVGRVPVLIAVDGPADEVDRLRNSAHDRRTPVLIGATALADGLAALHEDAKARHRRLNEKTELSPLSFPKIPRGQLHEAAAKELLSSVGIPTPRRAVCRSEEDAVAVFRDFTVPVVAKILDAEVLHKTDIGGVVLGISTEEQLRAAIASLERAGAREFLIEEMAPDGVDLLLGVRRDPVFGPIVVLGLGGIEAEVFADHAICGLPASRNDLEELPARLALRELLEGFRGRPAVDPSALATVIAALAGLFLASEHITEIEINPLRIINGGIVALDAVIIAGEGDHNDSIHS